MRFVAPTGTRPFSGGSCPRRGGGIPIDILYVGGLGPTQRGGSGILGTELVSGLAGLGHRLRALTPRTAETTGASARFDVQHPEIQTTWFPVSVASSDLLGGSRDSRYRQEEDAGVRAALPRLIAERRPDVIVIGRESIVGEVPPVARRHGIPTVVLVQGGRALLRIVEGDHDALARHQLERLRQVDVVIAIAHHLQQALAPLSLGRVTVIPNPVDLERFSPGERPPELMRAHAIGPHQVVIGHVSNLGPAKRPMDVVESAVQVLAANPNVVYLIVGDGPYRASMEARCRELGIAERVRFVGWVEHAAVPAYLRLADVVVMPSEHEGLPLVYLETQASGRVLVASDISATREVVVDGETGLIARRGDVRDLTATTLRVVGDSALRTAIGRAARAAVHAHAKPATLAAYVGIMEQLAASRRTSAPNLRARTEKRSSRLLAERLGVDLWALVEAQGGRLVEATPIGTLPSRLRARAAFRLRFADGRVMKGRRVNDESCGARVDRLSPLLEPRHFPRLLARQGAALLSEWVEGAPVVATGDVADVCRQAGAIQGVLHRTPASPDECRQARERWGRWASRLERDLDELVAGRGLDRPTATRAMAAATGAAPAHVDLGLVHGDLCLENIVLRDGVILVVDTEDLRIYACDHDLARTWYRWPMTAPGRQAYYDSYERHRSSRGFVDHFVHWAVIVLVESACFRLRARTGDIHHPLARLRALLAPEEVPAGSEARRRARRLSLT